MKKIVVMLALVLLVGLLAGCSNSMLKNSETGNYGPSWDLTMKLPAPSTENTFGDLVSVKSFSDFGFVVSDGNGDGEGDELSFTVVGSEEKPIGREVTFELPPLDVEREDPLFSETTDEFPLAGTKTLPEQEILFPLEGFQFAESDAPDYNKLKISVENTGDNSLDSLNLTVMKENGDRLAKLRYSDIAAGAESSEKAVDFNGEEIDYEKLKLIIAFEQASPTSAKINFSGFTNLNIVKAENINGDILSGFNFSQDIDIGNAAKINSYDYNDDDNIEDAELRFHITVPGAEGLKFDFSDTSINDNEVSYNSSKDYYFIRDDEEVAFGELIFSSTIDPVDESGSFSYDSTKELTAEVEMLGQAQFDNPTDDDEIPFEIEKNELVYEMDPQNISITEDEIDKITKYVLSEDTYLYTDITNGLPVGLKADIYLTSSDNDTMSKADLYKEENIVNENSVINIDGSSGSPVNKDNKFILGDIEKEDGTIEDGMITMIEKAVESGEKIYIGFKFIIGDLADNDFDTNGEKHYDFSDDQIIKTKAHIGVTVKVNQ